MNMNKYAHLERCGHLNHLNKKQQQKRNEPTSCYKLSIKLIERCQIIEFIYVNIISSFYRCSFLFLNVYNIYLLWILDNIIIVFKIIYFTIYVLLYMNFLCSVHLSLVSSLYQNHYRIIIVAILLQYLLI